jgi:predicted ATPase
MITIRKYNYPEIKLYAPDNSYIGLIKNEVEFNDIRIQVAREKAEGYYIVFEDKRVNILPDGDCDSWPKGFFDQEMKQLEILFKNRRGEPYKYDVYET